jgi:hypothetical protein
LLGHLRWRIPCCVLLHWPSSYRALSAKPTADQHLCLLGFKLTFEVLKQACQCEGALLWCMLTAPAAATGCALRTLPAADALPAFSSSANLQHRRKVLRNNTGQA